MNLPEPQSLSFMLSSVVAALFAILTIATNRSNKIVEFRHAWITEKKEITAKYIGLCHKLFFKKRDFYRRDYSYIKNKEDWNDISAVRDEIHTEKAKLRISLNPNKKYVKKMVNLEKRIFNNLNVNNKNFTMSKKCFNEHKILTKTYAKIAYRFYKKEWEDVKRGEFRYRLAFYFCMFMFLFIMVFVFSYSFYYYYDEKRILIFFAWLKDFIW